MKETKILWYLKIAKTIAEKSPCSRKKIGAIIIKNDAVLSIGYNGTVRGAINCGTEIPCIKDLYHEASYFKQGITSYQYCPVVHAELNAIINAARNGTSIFDSILFLSTSEGPAMTPCQNCRRYIVNAGIKDCYWQDKDGKIVHENVSDYIEMDNDWMNGLLKEKKVELEPVGLLENHCKKCFKPKWACNCEEEKQ